MQMAPKHDIIYVNFYTDGSAARKVAPAFPVSQPRKKPGAKRHKKTVVYVDPVAIFSLMVACVLLIMMAVGLTNLQNAQTEAAEMESYLEQLKAENAELNQKFDQEVDLETVEQSAIALGMVPKSQLESTTIQVEDIQIEEAPETFWSQVTVFLTNLFA